MTVTTARPQAPTTCSGCFRSIRAERADPRPYWQYLGEAVEPWSYLKSACWKDLGYPGGVYRSGP